MENRRYVFKLQTLECFFCASGFNPDDEALIFSVCVCFLADASGGDFQGGASEASVCPSRHLDGEDGLYLPEPDCASLHDSEGLFHRLG